MVGIFVGRRSSRLRFVLFPSPFLSAAAELFLPFVRVFLVTFECPYHEDANDAKIRYTKNTNSFE